MIETASELGGTSMRGRYEGSVSDTEVRLAGTRQWSLRTGLGTQACRGVFRRQPG